MARVVVGIVVDHQHVVVVVEVVVDELFLALGQGLGECWLGGSCGGGDGVGCGEGGGLFETEGGDWYKMGGNLLLVAWSVAQVVVLGADCCCCGGVSIEVTLLHLFRVLLRQHFQLREVVGDGW